MWIADLHIHSRFARATSRQCEPVMLDWWARRKGIDVLGTGDCTHAGWRAMLADALVPDGSGFPVESRFPATLTGLSAGAHPGKGELLCKRSHKPPDLWKSASWL